MHFVDGWSIVQVLGEGAFGEVKLLVNDETQEAVAVKVLNTATDADAQMSVRKEIAVHKQQNHPNIIRYFGHRREGPLDYIFLEYAAGGELFDMIEPDVGMATSRARKYFLELISAVEYLHNNGVTHRDIKPENILLSKDDHVKLSDFGMATMFRKNGNERLVDKKCGTLPYVAPEVLLRPYSADAADVWSCGITLVAMLAGELPWDAPDRDCAEYMAWRDGSVTLSPWSKLDTSVLILLKKILCPLAEKRPTACDIPKMKWCQLSHVEKTYASNQPPSKRLNTGVHDLPVGLSLTQPLPIAIQDVGDVSVHDDDHTFSFSQPVVLDDLLLSSQLHVTQTTCVPIYQRLVKRMTRLRVNITAHAALTLLMSVLEDLGCVVRSQHPHTLSASGCDRRKSNFTFKVNLLSMNDQVLIDFRLSKGDGLEFKKLFLRIKNCMGDVVIRKPVPWVSDSVPS